MELSNSLAPDAIVCADAGNNRVWMLCYFQTKQAGTYFGTYGIAGMSWSLPVALTAKLLHPDVSASRCAAMALLCKTMFSPQPCNTTPR
jgi:thiamine pyrophosphate-dependent acetolactate synthase large subunit-like protein